jgi:hypothetical protein
MRGYLGFAWKDGRKAEFCRWGSMAGELVVHKDEELARRDARSILNILQIPVP